MGREKIERSVLSVGDGGREERKACGLLLSWGGDWGIGFGIEEGKSRSEDSLFAFLTNLARGFPGNTCGSSDKGIAFWGKL